MKQLLYSPFYFIGILVVLCVQGCQSTQQHKEIMTTKEQKSLVNDYFSARGKLNIVFEQQKKSVRFDWSSTPQKKQLKIQDPFFGLTLGEWVKEDQKESLKIGTLSYNSSEIEEISLKYLGAPIPFYSLHWWLQKQETPKQNGDDWIMTILPDQSIEIKHKVRAVQLRFYLN
jgi:outer membrane biogenesis lipoprotein LolB